MQGTSGDKKEDFMGKTNDENNPSELLLGIFFNSEKDMTDSLYVSFDGCNFRKIASPYVDAYPNDADQFPIQGGQGNCLHDPGLIYKDGRLWTMSGFTDRINDSTGQPKNSTFVPMWGVFR